MKYKIGLIIIGIMIVSSSYLLYGYYNHLDNEKQIKREVERTKVEYIFGNMTHSQAQQIAEDRFINTIKLIANDYFEYFLDDKDKPEKYLINGNENYIRVFNYDSIKEFLNNESINIYNNKVSYLEYENNDYIIARKEVNEKYVGSILSISDYNDNEIIFKVQNYYCDNYQFEGIIDTKPECNIIDIKESYFTLIREKNLLKIKDINEFYNNKIY